MYRIYNFGEELLYFEFEKALGKSESFRTDKGLQVLWGFEVHARSERGTERDDLGSVWIYDGLVFSYALAQNVVGIVLMDFLEDQFGLRYASVLVNLLDGISAVFKVVATHASEDYTSGRFIMINFCATSYPLGLMLLWVCASASSHFGARAWHVLSILGVIFATLLIALGKAGSTILSDFFKYQLRKKITNMYNDKEKEYMKELERIQFPLHLGLTCSDLPKRNYMRGFTTRIGPTRLKSKVINKSGKWIVVTKMDQPLNLWGASAQLIGVAIAIYFFGNSRWRTKFRISSLAVGIAYLGFLCGILWYSHEERPTGSPLTTIYRVFLAAFRKRKLAYPSSAEGYSSNSRNIEASDVSENPFYTREDGSSSGNNEGSNDLEDPDRRQNDCEVHLKPRDPSFLSFLDKAAIIIRNNQIEERQLEVCTVEQVRDVKSLFFIIPLGLTFFAYSLVSASGNTYFVEQATNLDSKVGKCNDVPVVIFPVLGHVVAGVVGYIQSRKQVVGPIWTMTVGLFCSVLCCISAGVVERYRLSMATGKDPDNDVIPLSIMILTPQFVLLGLMQGFAEHGLRNFVQDRVPASMTKFLDPGIGMLLGIGKLSSILFAFICHWWIKDSINNSHLDWYFFMLATFSLVFFVIYVCYAKLELPKLPKFEGPDTNEEGNVGRMREFKMEVISA